SGSGTELVVKLNDTAPGSGGKIFGSFQSTSVNAAGTVSFQGNPSSGVPIGIFQKPAGGALAPVVLQDAVTPVGGTIFLIGNSTTTTGTGAVRVQPSILGAPDAYHGVFLWSATPVTVMSTADLLPAGAQT